MVGDCGHEAQWWFGDCGHDLVGIDGASVTVLMGLRSGWWVLVGVEKGLGGWWWVLVGVEIRVGFVVGGGFCGGCWYWGKARLRWWGSDLQVMGGINGGSDLHLGCFCFCFCFFWLMVV